MVALRRPGGLTWVKVAAKAQYVGLTLAPTSSWAIAAAAVYLALAGSALVLDGGIAGDPPWCAAAVIGAMLAWAPPCAVFVRLAPVLRWPAAYSDATSRTPTSPYRRMRVSVPADSNPARTAVAGWMNSRGPSLIATNA